MECELESGNGPCYYECIFEKSDDGLAEMKSVAARAYKIYNVWDGTLQENSELKTQLKNKNNGHQKEF